MSPGLGDNMGRNRQTYGYAKNIRTVLVHLLLLTGAAVFVMPFIWLVSTSFKEESDIFRYPPVWIPRIQASAKMEDGIHKLSRMDLKGKAIEVAEIDERQDGTIVRVMPGYPGEGREFLASRAILKPVRISGLKLDNYTRALDFMPPETKKGALYLWNTAYLTVLSVLGTLISCSMVAFSFARLRWPGRDVVFAVMMSTMMIPGAVTMVPVFLIFRWLGWVDTLRPLWVPTFFAGAFGVFLLRQFFLTIPSELEDAARIDGCGYFGIYYKIMLPLIKPALIALAIMTAFSAWNNFMGPLIYINSPEKMPLAYALQLFQGLYSSEYGMLMAASTLVMLPVLIVFFCAQRYIIEGITLTGIKG